MQSQNKQKFLLYRIRVFKDAKAFDELYQEHKEGLRRFLAIKLPTLQDADDALSTVFMRAWSYIQSTDVGHTGGLLFTIARATIAEFYRSRRETVSLDAEPDTADTLSDVGKGQARIETQSEVALIKEHVADLPEDQAAALILRYVEGLSIAEVAEHIGKTPNATQVMLHRTLKALRQKLEPKK